MSALGMGGLGLADQLAAPTKNYAQTKVDTDWLSKSRANDDAQGWGSFRGVGPRKVSAPARKIPSEEIWQLNRVIQASFLLEDLSHGARYALAPSVRPAGRKHSGTVTILSPLEKTANFKPLLREALGMNPVGLPGVGGAISRAWDNRPPALGGSPKWLSTAQDVRDLFFKDDLILNASGIAIGRKREFLPGMAGKIVKLPLAVGALAALNAAYGWGQERRRASKSDARFEAALSRLRSDEGFRERYLSLIDPQTESGQMALPKIRDGFGILDRYAPTVASDPNLAASYVEALVAGTDHTGVAMSPAEYAQHVERAVSLETSLQRQSPSLTGRYESMVGRLID